MTNWKASSCCGSNFPVKKKNKEKNICLRYLCITEALRYSSLGCAGEAVRRHLGSLDGLKQRKMLKNRVQTR